MFSFTQNLSQKKILVLGLGVTGFATARFLKKRGALVLGVDENEQVLQKARQEGFECALISDFLGQTKKLDFAILSPGFSLKHPVVEKLKSQSIPFTGEIEFASYFNQSPIIAITGTNGKSTTTELIAHILKNSGFKVQVGGNLGRPWLEMIDEEIVADWVVLELSSYQLETIKSFHPQISIFLNLTDDHFERHGSLEEYCKAKSKIFQNQNSSNYFIFNEGDAWVKAASLNCLASLHPFSSTHTQLKNGIYWSKEEEIISEVTPNPFSYDLKNATLKGLHNIENMMASIAACELVGVDTQLIQKSLENFSPLKHRLEWVTQIAGVDFYDDSKGTNVGAVAMSLASFDRPVILILGGRDKGGDYKILSGLVKNKVKHLVLLGEASQKIALALEGCSPYTFTSTMQEAVDVAFKVSKKNDIVLLSPACSSFDLFKDYKHRGDEFQKFVRKLKEVIEWKEKLIMEF